MCEGFEPLADIERLYLRNTRTPGHNALNMRARVAALRTTHGRINEVIDQYGLDAFLATQDGIVDYVEQVVRRRLREIPDGEWFSQAYIDHDGISPAVYPLHCRIVKEGERLIFDMTGTAPQAVGSINCARPAMEGAALGVVLIGLCYDLPWSIGALRNIVEIVSDEGTVNNAASPAGVSMASVMGTLSTQDVVIHAFAKMLLASDRHRDEAQATWTAGINFSLLIAGSPTGEPSVGAVVDAFSGGGGARSFADGIDSGGIIHSMGSQAANAETVESRVPVLQIYRRELPDGGGAGRYRGGVAIEFATVPHKVPIRPAGLSTVGSGIAMPGGRGLAGGLPGAAGANVIVRGAGLAARFAAGEIPLSPEDMTAGTVEVPEAKSFTMLDEDDVLIGRMSSGAGYGDPLRRDPTLVLADVRDGLVSGGVATALYGVTITAAGEVDLEATAAARDRIRAERRAAGRPAAEHAGPARTIAGGTVLHPVSDTVEAVEHDGERSVRCTVCAHRFGAYDEDHKRGALVRDVPLSAANPHNGLCDPDYVLREFCCPGCGTAVAVDVQHRADPVIDESRFGGYSQSKPT
jgi:N-methylhydantoinase B